MKLNLETKLPPPLVMLVCAALMYAAAQLPIGQNVLPRFEILTALLVLLGILIDLVSIFSFYRAKTTVNPIHPNQASHLVSNGIYRFSRNPMYLGMACYLSAWAAWLAQPLAWLGVAAFVLYITYFQILPEERVLTQKFGQEYTDYCQRVRRWI